MNIRHAQAADLPRIVDIYNQAVVTHTCTADLDPVSVESRRVWFEQHGPEQYPLWVAEQGGEVMGWCSLSAHRPGRAALRHIAEISYYVDLSCLRQGIGGALMRHALAACPTLQIKHLFSYLLPLNPASVGLLEHFGFEKWGELPGAVEIDGQVCSHLIYGRHV